MTLLGIDLGERRVGLALSDPEKRYAFPFRTLSRQSDRQIVGLIAELVRAEGVEGMVLGEPKGPRGKLGDSAKRARKFARRLQAACELPVELVDETLTSNEAERRLREAGVDPKKSPERVDAVAAQIILQEGLDRRASRNETPS